jgi:hypothetical protein
MILGIVVGHIGLMRSLLGLLMAIMNILNGKNTVLDFLKDAINKKEYARAYYILTLILKAKEHKKTLFKG